YFGDLRTRDAAYHQGTVWAWLIGPFIDAWLKVYPDRLAEARSFLTGFDAHLSEACIGTISEIFDAEAPYHPRGCVSQAWSVAEVLRCWIQTEPAQGTVRRHPSASFMPPRCFFLTPHRRERRREGRETDLASPGSPTPTPAFSFCCAL